MYALLHKQLLSWKDEKGEVMRDQQMWLVHEKRLGKSTKKLHHGVVGGTPLLVGW